MGKREEQYDLIRVVAMCFAIGVHTMALTMPFKSEYNLTWFLAEILVLIFFTCNGLFFILSGKFTLGNENLLIKGLGRYYLDKVIKIIIPLIIYSLIVYFVNLALDNQLNVANSFKYFKVLYEGGISKSYWFIYALLGIYLVAPFLYKMISSMNLKELKVLIVIVFAFQIITVYSGVFSKGFGIRPDTFGLTGWISYFLLGFAIEKICDTKYKRNIVILLGVCSIIISILERRFLTDTSYGVHDLSITMVLITLMFFFLIRDFVKVTSKIKNKLSLMSKYFLAVYLVHTFVLKILSKFIKINSMGFDMIIKLILLFVLTLFISFALGFIIDNLIVKPIQNLIKKHWQLLKK